jgi:hypothetical protein
VQAIAPPASHAPDTFADKVGAFAGARNHSDTVDITAR